MQRTNLYLDERQTTALDRRARAEGISRAELVRRLIDRSMNETPDSLDSDLAAIESSFGVLTDIQGPDRGHDERTTHLERIRRR